MDKITKASVHFVLFLLLPSAFLRLETVKLASCNGDANVTCTVFERQALVEFRKGLTDPSGRLSSWAGKDCCRWRGVVCSQGSVVGLDLRNQYGQSPDDAGGDGATVDDFGATHALGGEISGSLLDLKELRYLDLSMNDFGGLEIPKFIGSFQKLRYLNLSGASFGGAVPADLGNLSGLVYLDLKSNSLESVDGELRWLSALSSLTHLNLGGLNLSRASASWHRAVNSLSSLSELRLSSCGLSSLPDRHSLPFDNLTSSLSVLDLSNNGFNSSIPDWLFNFSSLAYLDLNNNNLQGSVPEGFGGLITLEHIDLSFNYYLGGPLPRSLGRLCDLRLFKQSFNSISGEITEFIDGLSECFNGSRLESLDLGFNYKLEGFLPQSLGRLKRLRSLHLTSNSFVGSIPNSIGNLTSLQEFYLADNEMNGTISESVGQLSAVVALDLSENPWVGVVTESHFSNLTSLTELAIKKSSPNVTLVFDVSSQWVPPFKLSYLELQSCQLGPKFPAWLRNQNRLKTIVLNNARISDSIPDWFWKLDLQLYQLDLASNQLSGRVPNSLKFSENAVVDLSSNRFQGSFPHFSSNLSSLYLRDNLFYGPMPEDIGIAMPMLSYFDISWNNLNGTIPLSMVKMKGMTNLILSNNNFSGEIPLIWEDKPDLYQLDIANNSLSGEIPVSIGTLSSLMFLTLSDNKLSGKIPSSLKNCKNMVNFDLGNNRLSGNLPSWMEEMGSLLTLSLRSNLFDGNIPSQVCRLSHLHILDLADNNLSGSLPSCLGNLKAMATEISEERYEGQLTVVMKGRELIYQNTLYLVNSIDLSDNNLSGELPALRNLSRLVTLNLSMNHFTGNVPGDIGTLSQLETLDLSKNQLSGQIPPTMASLTSLNHLNLSYNRLSGRIPTSNQFQTLTDPSIYRNNLALCGQPLAAKCPGDKDDDDDDDDEATGTFGGDDGDDGDEFEMKFFYASMGLGFAVGFWGVLSPLILNRSWRGAYFRCLDKMKGRVVVVVAVNVARLRTKCKW